VLCGALGCLSSSTIISSDGHLRSISLSDGEDSPSWVSVPARPSDVGYEQKVLFNGRLRVLFVLLRMLWTHDQSFPRSTALRHRVRSKGWWCSPYVSHPLLWVERKFIYPNLTFSSQTTNALSIPRSHMHPLNGLLQYPGLLALPGRIQPT
jgi:hypothetical protein